MFVIVSCDCSWLSVRGRLLAEQSRCWFETSWTSCDVSIMTLLISKYNAVLDSKSILGMLDSVLVTRHLHGNDYRRDHGNDHKINQHHFPLFWLTSKVHHCFQALYLAPNNWLYRKCCQSTHTRIYLQRVCESIMLTSDRELFNN